LSGESNGRSDSPASALAERRRLAQATLPERLQAAGGLTQGVARKISRESGLPEATVQGVGSFYHLLARSDRRIRVCTGLSCALAGATEQLARAESLGLPVEGTSCLAACDVAPAVLEDRQVHPHCDETLLSELASRLETAPQQTMTAEAQHWRGHVGPQGSPPQQSAFGLDREPDFSGRAYRAAADLGSAGVIEQLEAAGLQGRGGAGFPAHIKWSAVLEQRDLMRYVVLNADEGEPGTFKDRELLLRRPDLVIEGLAIAASAIGAREIYLYLRGEFGGPWQSTVAAIERFETAGYFPELSFRMHAGQGAYICGEESAMLEALEGRRGMPRHRPPLPVERGLFGRPTLVHNVETIAAVPYIVERGGAAFRELGRGEAGPKLYCVSGHVRQPGTYELPLGVTLDELIEAAGGLVGELKAFSPGGASSGFLPASERTRPLDFGSLAEVGSMLGSAGVVVLNQSADMREAALCQLDFFQQESCGQCAPCRIGTRYLHEAVLGLDGENPGGPRLELVDDVSWQLREGSICGLGQTAPLPLTSALKHFPEAFRPRDGAGGS
jgi:NADH:ubiquinone oxidoreductase subunit F (NADH-binding)/NADH:ubiquinone oxidoreductase subunit E